MKICFFVNLKILLAQKAGDSSVGLRHQNDGGNGKRKAENGKQKTEFVKIYFFVNLAFYSPDGGFLTIFYSNTSNYKSRFFASRVFLSSQI